MKHFLKILEDSKGATAIEYGLIAALIGIASITAMSALGSTLGDTFQEVSDELDGTAAAARGD